MQTPTVSSCKFVAVYNMKAYEEVKTSSHMYVVFT